MLAPAVRHDSPLPADHPCQGCVVRSIAVCGVLDGQRLGKFKRLGSDFRLSAGQPLFHESDPADRVFTVTRGTLKLYKLLADGRRQITGFMHPGDCVGVSLNDEYAFTAEAMEPSQLCSFRVSSFDDFVEEHDAMERDLYRRAAHEVAAAQERFVLLGRKTAAERVASFLISLAQRAESHDGESGRYIRLPMSRSDIADYLGLTKETISRTISTLKRKLLIRLEAKDRIEILDRQGLEHAAVGDDRAC